MNNTDEHVGSGAGTETSQSGGHYIGDYTETPEAKKKRRQAIAKRKAAAEAKRQKQLAFKRKLRLAGMACVGMMTIGLSSLVGASATPPKALKKPAPIQANSVKDDLDAILPVKVTMVRNGVARVVVERDWLDVPASDRQYAAETALVTLKNRGIEELAIHCTDGLLLASGMAGEGVTLHEDLARGG